MIGGSKGRENWNRVRGREGKLGAGVEVHVEGGRKAAHRERKGKRETLESYGGTELVGRCGVALESEEVTFF